MELRRFTRAPEGSDGSPLATAEIVFSSGAGVQRYDWYRERNYIEELVVEEGAIRMGRLQRGAPLLNSHSSWDLEDQLGVVENPAIEAGQGTCTATFSRRESVAGYVQDVADKIIRTTNS
ncbi:MAG TPA: peptidase S14, partial [Lentisphaeria bacterium]|nr:peptidase S14 [Lentisphaeria bacterium]